MSETLRCRQTRATQSPVQPMRLRLKIIETGCAARVLSFCSATQEKTVTVGGTSAACTFWWLGLNYTP